MSAKASVFFVDDHPIVCEGIRVMLQGERRFTIMGSAADGMAGWRFIEEHRPVIAVLDLDLPKLGGLEIGRRLRYSASRTRVVILTMHDKESLVLEALELGVRGYVLKENAVRELVKCLQAVADGGCYLSPSLAHCLMKRVSGRSAGARRSGLTALTPTERRILSLIAARKTSKDIAAALCISPLTVDTHRHNICVKLELKGNHSLLQYAWEHAAEL